MRTAPPRIVVPAALKSAAQEERQPQPGSQAHSRARRWSAASAFIWVAVVLAVLLGMSRTLVGLWGIDVVALVFGVMTPAARAVYALLGIAAIYCGVVVVSRESSRRAGRH